MVIVLQIQSGGSQSLQFLGKLQNKAASNVVGGATAGSNIMDPRTVQRLKVTPGSSGESGWSF